jgi:hypothetical protein
MIDDYETMVQKLKTSKNKAFVHDKVSLTDYEYVPVETK